MNNNRCVYGELEWLECRRGGFMKESCSSHGGRESWPDLCVRGGSCYVHGQNTWLV